LKMRELRTLRAFLANDDLARLGRPVPARSVYAVENGHDECRVVHFETAIEADDLEDGGYG